MSTQKDLKRVQDKNEFTQVDGEEVILDCATYPNKAIILLKNIKSNSLSGHLISLLAKRINDLDGIELIMVF